MNQILYLIKQLYRFTGKKLLLNLFGMMLISCLDGVAVLLLIPLISLSGIMNVSEEFSPVAELFRWFENIPPDWRLPLILGLYLFIVVSQAIIQRRLTIQDVQIHTRFINHLRMETYKAILQAKWSFFVKKRKSDLIQSLTGELGQATGGIQLFLQLLRSVTFTLIQIIIAFWLSAKMAGFVLFFGLILLLCSRTFIYRSKAVGGKLMDMAKSYLAGITDHFNGIKDIKSNQLEGPRYHWLRTWSDEIENERLKQTKLSTQSQLLYKVSSGVLIVVFVYLSITFFRTEKEQLIMIAVIFSRLWPRFTGIQSSLESLASMIPSLQALNNLQVECKAAREAEELTLSSAMIEPLSMVKGLECRNVSFRYNVEESLNALHKVNLFIPSKQMTAIVGKSGAGKSTLIDILMGLMQPEEGEVLIDGVLLAPAKLVSLRASLSYVSQDPFLFNASIRDNLLMILPEAEESQLWEALEFAAISDLVQRLPQKLDTLIGDRGVRLSGGERQRLVLARAILKKPSILVLDEATSALDSENEMKIQQAIERLKGVMTIIVIAHRLSTIRNADQVIVLEQGEVVQQGKFEELAQEKGGVFASLLGSQFAEVKVAVTT